MHGKVIAPCVLLTLLLVFVPAASASAITGTIKFSSADQNVTVGLTSLQWGSGAFVTTNLAAGTDLTYDAGINLAGATGVTGSILDLSLPVPLPVLDFMTFPATAPGLTFALTGVDPGSSNTNCYLATHNGDSCSLLVSPGIISPLILTKNGGGTGVTLSLTGTATDSMGDMSTWYGLWTSQVTNLTPGGPIATPALIEAAFAANPLTFKINDTYSAGIVATVTSIPESSTSLMALAGLGLLLLGRLRLPRKQS